jgi:peptide/nickel transport system permease protein
MLKKTLSRRSRPVRYYWILRRIGGDSVRIFITIFIVLIVSFVLVRLSPYSPVTAQLINRQSAGATSVQAQIDYYYSLYPSGPLYIQFLNYFWAVVNGRLGHSIISGLPVTTIIGEALPWTLLIVVSSTLISFAIGTVLGMLLAYRRGSRADTSGLTILTVLSSVPVYIVALVFLVLLTFAWPIFPHGGAYDIADTPGFNYPFISSVLYHATLPVLTLTLVNFGGWALSMRANTVSILGEDYVTAVETRGISPFRIATRYVGRNAILPQFTSLVLALGFSFTGAVFVENVFTYPGLGYLLINAVNINDYSLLMGIFITYIVAVVIGLLIADLTYGVLDPRTRRS